MLDFQDGKCGVCRKPENGKALAVDHCHETGRVRGLLCSKCNTAIGLLKDSRELLQRAERWVMEPADIGLDEEWNVRPNDGAGAGLS